jgi:hypothetical protein
MEQKNDLQILQLKDNSFESKITFNPSANTLP